MKRIVIGVVTIIVLVAAIAVVRTLLLSKPEEAAPAAPPIAVDARAVAQHLGAAVRFRTVSYGGGAHEAEKDQALAQSRDWMVKTYPNFNKVAKRELIGQSVVYTWPGKNAGLKPILLMAHMDVVPIVPGTERSWAHAPFSGDVAGGYVWGRGAIDDKGSLVMILEAAERLAKSGVTPERTIMFAFGQDEEVGGMEGNAVIAKTLAARGVHFFFVLDEGGAIVDEPFAGVEKPIAFVAVEEKGYLSLELVAHGEGGHSSRPTHDMAIVRLAGAVLKVVDHPFASGLDTVQRERLAVIAPYVPFPQRLLLANLWLTEPIVDRFIALNPEGEARLHTTIAPTIIQGGVKDNVLPPEARAVINFRLHPRDTIAGVIEHVRKAIDDPKVDVIALNETQDEASPVADIHGAAYKYLVSQIQGSFNGIPVAPDMTTGATDSRHYAKIADAVFRLDPFHFGPGDLSRVHGTNERLAIRDLAPAVGFYMRLIENAK
ncbi:MAG TPA: M20 family peptidase [Rhizomicrobium sp.]|nr:M20 family peptidase [Rhizomicrobium sp.]